MALEVLRICGLISESRNTTLLRTCSNETSNVSTYPSSNPKRALRAQHFCQHSGASRSTYAATKAHAAPSTHCRSANLKPWLVSDSSIFQYTNYFIFHNTIYPEFDPHILTMVSAGYILENNTGLPHQLFFPSPISPKTSNPSFLKIPSAPTFSPTFRSPQWSFPPNSLWKESFPSATLPYANDFQIQVSVNAGHLIANSTSIRDAQTDTCILEYIGQRPEGERFYADRIILAEKAEIPTPIVEKSKRETFYVYRKGNKGVLFDKICTYLDVSGVLEYGEVVENEGKTDSIYGVWPKPLQRRVIIRKGWKYILET
ncbi:hypothetical protein HBH70_101730 [Parastagonospora nodorum]|nr:hypothetical protein HBH70_101730 [Parastagonospora nodorum]KAH5713318.1 hypothetical protein HBI18_203250 [Parastagonospora nodorum]